MVPPIVAVVGAAAVVVSAWAAYELTDDPGERTSRAVPMGVAAAVAAVAVAVVFGLVAWWQGRRREPSSAVRPPAPQRPDPLAKLPRFGDPELSPVRDLRVHRAPPLEAQAGSGPVPELPTWVPRRLAPRVESLMVAARDGGGFVVVAGDSAVGKTRLLYETARTVFAGWPVLAPPLGDGAEVVALAERADELSGPVVVWLDELYRFLPGPGVNQGATPVTAAALQRLRAAPAAVVVVLGSLWREQLEELHATDDSPDGRPRPRFPEAVDALRLVDEIVMLEGFKDREVDDARQAGAKDPRLAAAAADPDFGVTQALAGARQLMARYERATAVHRALLVAAIDARRVGARPPLPPELLGAMARGYLNKAQPDDDWVQPALAELSRHDGPHDRGTAPLLAHYDPTNRLIVGYDVADYLLQRATRDRRYQRLPYTAWHALTTHTTDPETLNRLADAAEARGLDHHAEALFRKAADAGGHIAALSALSLVRLLVERGDEEALRARADAGDNHASAELARLLGERGDRDALQARAERGDDHAARRLAELLGERGDRDALQARAERGDDHAAGRLAWLLGERGDEEALRARADAGDRDAAGRLAWLLVERGDRDALQARADAGDRDAAFRLAELLGKRGDEEALRARADAGDTAAAWWLAQLRAERGDLDELRARADAGHRWAVDLLAKRGEAEALRARADAGDRDAARRLARLLVERGDEEALRARADAGDNYAAGQLAELLVERGDEETLRARADAGDNYAAGQLAELLVERGDEETLRARADAGDNYAAGQLAELLVERGDEETLWARADAGDGQAALWLARLLGGRGDVEGVRRLVDAGVPGAVNVLRRLVAGGDGKVS